MILITPPSDSFTFRFIATLTVDAPALIAKIKSKNMKVGIAISPDTGTHHLRL
jgi:pentose-5-phosphate-3-epimerase